MIDSFWSQSPEFLLKSLGSSLQGISESEARQRALIQAPNRLHSQKSHWVKALLASQFRSPVTLLLIFGAGLSLALGDVVEGCLILFILLASGAIGYWQEKRASNTVQKLLGLLQVRVTVLRAGVTGEIRLDELVPGDVISLKAGSAVPGDALILASQDLFVDESSLTGESFPAEKRSGTLPAETGQSSRSNSVFLGTHVITGTATALVVGVGTDTLFGNISHELSLRPPETTFEHGLKHFGYLLLEVALALALIIFAVNVGFHRPILESLLFTLALAVGLTPQLLPAIQGITLAHGAARMAKRQVIVRRLSAIEDIGGMTVLCTDKTGTLTEGVTSLAGAWNPWGKASLKLRLFAYLNASLQSGYANPIDEALRQDSQPEASAYLKIAEVPYDFSRKRLSVAVEGNGARLLITKGTMEGVLNVCALAEGEDGKVIPILEVRKGIEEREELLSRQGQRCLGVAYRELALGEMAGTESEKNLVFLGMLEFSDPLKKGARDSLNRLKVLGVLVKLVTGDNRYVAAKVAEEAGLNHEAVLTGSEMRKMGRTALAGAISRYDVFAEVDPNQKETVIAALKKAGHSVGFLGDGINDAAGLHMADVGISVESAVDVTKQAADIVLLRKDLGVLAEGVREGRRAFANTLKYIFITTSANFGNMLSMAGASLFSTFLPMLPRQILLLNVLSDLPAMALPSDHLDAEQVSLPRRWDMREIQRFMLVFGLISSTFDFVTFGTLLALKVPAPQFRTAWFMESVLSELMILLIIRTHRWSFQSRMGNGLLFATLSVTIVIVVLPFLPFADLLGFQPLSWRLMGILSTILVGYGTVSELAKRPFYGSFIKPR